MKIRTNKLKADIDYKLLFEKHDIFIVKTSEKHFRQGAYVLDDVLLRNNVQSVLFEKGNLFYILMVKNSQNQSILKSILLNSDGGEFVSLQQATITNITPAIIVQLLFNSLGSAQSEILRFNNLTGHLYAFHSQWVKYWKRGEQRIVSQIACLELKVSADMILSLYVRTFTSELLKGKIVFGKTKFDDYPKYVLGTNNTLRRKLVDDADSSYILHQIDGQKTEIPFLDIQNKEHFDCSKMGVLYALLSLFKNKYSQICKLEFDEIDCFQSLEYDRYCAKENEAVIFNLLKSVKIKIVDLIGDEYSNAFSQNVKSIIENKYGVNVAIGKRVDKSSLNICIVHNALFYKGINDPHDIKYDGITVQHITLEDFGWNATFAVSTIVNELLIKQDIVERKLSLYDWGQLSFGRDVSFGIKYNVNDEDKYLFMKIQPDGSFEFLERELSLFEMNDYFECVNIFEETSDIKGIIQFEDGAINVIKDTKLITIPKIDEIANLLLNGVTQLRGKQKRDELLSSMLDIKLFEDDKSQYYFVGTIGEGMRVKIGCAANIRKIEPYNNSALRFDKLLQLMNVTFVHNGQLTVMPFPFKYLMEYARSMK